MPTTTIVGRNAVIMLALATDQRLPHKKNTPMEITPSNRDIAMRRDRFAMALPVFALVPVVPRALSSFPAAHV